MRLRTPCLAASSCGPCAALDDAATGEARSRRIGSGPRHACTVACASTFGNGRERKKRGKCEIVPPFDGCVLFFAHPLSPHPLPPPLSTSGEGHIALSPLGRDGERPRGTLSLKGREEGRCAHHVFRYCEKRSDAAIYHDAAAIKNAKAQAEGCLNCHTPCEHSQWQRGGLWLQ
jgi:hypothetical protein